MFLSDLEKNATAHAPLLTSVARLNSALASSRLSPDSIVEKIIVSSLNRFTRIPYLGPVAGHTNSGRGAVCLWRLQVHRIPHKKPRGTSNVEFECCKVSRAFPASKYIAMEGETDRFPPFPVNLDLDFGAFELEAFSLDLVGTANDRNRRSSRSSVIGKFWRRQICFPIPQKAMRDHLGKPTSPFPHILWVTRWVIMLTRRLSK